MPLEWEGRPNQKTRGSLRISRLVEPDRVGNDPAHGLGLLDSGGRSQRKRRHARREPAAGRGVCFTRRHPLVFAARVRRCDDWYGRDEHRRADQDGEQPCEVKLHAHSGHGGRKQKLCQRPNHQIRL